MSVKVAVRVRPFNSREKNMNATLVISMTDKQTTIFEPDTRAPKDFTFDFSYWSHDGYREGEDGMLIATDIKYCNQTKVFNDLGEGVLTNAFEGYNSTLFAYGQTGSGKSYSMVGYSVNVGIIPMVCEQMFVKMAEKKTEDTTYQVVVTMLEIYNEVVRDLLNPKANKRKGGLKIRSKPGVGVYVEGLTPVAVESYEEVERRMEEGTSNRTIGSTKMNATSSRAHTVFGVRFTTIRHVKETGMDSEMTASMNLVDLAGSERQGSTGATGDRLKEGCAINQSLSALGNVISALADKAMGKKKVFIPYRNSALTFLLQDALGGNSKTIMIAAVSPADVNYEESLSTLRYADRAKKIKNKAVKMENPTDRIIRLLKEENTRLKKMMGGKSMLKHMGGGGDGEEGDEVKLKEAQQKHQTEMKLQMQENMKIMADMQKSWEEKLADAKDVGGGANDGSVVASQAAKSGLPRLVNLHEDPTLSECVVYLFKPGITIVGRSKQPPESEVHSIVLGTPFIKKEHARFEQKNNQVTLAAFAGTKTFKNGDLIKETAVPLVHGDRIILGNNMLFRFVDPSNDIPDDDHVPAEDAYHNAVEELQSKQGMRLVMGSVGAEEGKFAEMEMAKRVAAEKKMKAMESKMKKEAAMAKKILAEQRKAIQEGREFTEEDRLRILHLEEEANAKEEALQVVMQDRSKLTEEILQKQMGRSRKTVELEEQLTMLLPLIEEANEMGKEMQKNILFSVQLVTDNNETDLKLMKEKMQNADIQIRVFVKSTVNHNQWKWKPEKFDNRLFLMRDMYAKFMDTGDAEVQKKLDPFWDPPEPQRIGRAYVYMKALAQLVEVESDFVIVNDQGEGKGRIFVDIFPEDEDGEELDYLDSPDDLVGQTATFCMRIPKIVNIPEQFRNEVYVHYDFYDQEGQTETLTGHTAGETLKVQHEKRFQYTNIDEKMKQYFLTKAAVFSVFGYSNKQEAELLAAMAGDDAVCEQCEEADAELYCTECNAAQCTKCFTLLHKSKRKRGHKSRAIDKSVLAAKQVPEGVTCMQCEETVAEIKCNDCKGGPKLLCNSCNELLHRSAKKKKHERVIISTGELAPLPKPVLPAKLKAYAHKQGRQSLAQKGHTKKIMGMDATISHFQNKLAKLRDSDQRRMSVEHNPYEHVPMDNRTSRAQSRRASIAAEAAMEEAKLKLQLAKEQGKPICFRCEESEAAVVCTDCKKPGPICVKCNELLHRSKKKRNHTRNPIL